jgi:hypothetical protein
MKANPMAKLFRKVRASERLRAKQSVPKPKSSEWDYENSTMAKNRRITKDLSRLHTKAQRYAYLEDLDREELRNRGW